MAHEIESRFVVGHKNIWSGIPGSKELVSAPSIADAIIQAGLNWNVALKPVFDGNGKPIQGYYATTRDKDDSVLGIVQSRYRPLQNIEAFESFESLVTSGGLTLETAGSLRGGQIVWILGKIAEQAIGKHSHLNQYLLLSNGHNGRWTTKISSVTTRTECMNTLRAATAEGGIVSIKHTSGNVGRMTKEMAIYNSEIERFKLHCDDYRQMAETSFTDVQFQTYADSLFSKKKEEKDELMEDLLRGSSADRKEVVGELIQEDGRANRARNQVIETHHNLSEIIGGPKGTAFRALNSVTHYLTHQAPRNVENGAIKAVDGNPKMDEAHSLLMEMIK